MNEYDSAKMAEVLALECPIEKTENLEEADIILLNTCSIREKAQEKVFSDLGRFKPFKDKKPGVIIGVGGCVASQEGEMILKRAPYVDVVFGPQTLHRLPQLIKTAQASNRSQVDISFPEIEKFDHLPAPKADGVTAFVSIMEGCSKYCSFCVVPYTRGEEVSRPFDDVITEIALLAQQGVVEVNLLGQNVNAYRGLTHDGKIANLPYLIQHINAIDEIKRIRYTTSHPVEFSDELIETYASVPKLVDHLHLPVQSGCDRILGLMKRGHTTLEYKSKIKKLRAIRPNLSLSSDFIVGFPGETDDDFEKTMNFIAQIGYDHSFSFVYSPRPGTPAANLHDPIPLEVKKQRLQLLQNRITAQSRAISMRMLNTVVPVLVEGPAKFDGQIQGRTENNRMVNFDGPIELTGQLVNVKLTESLTNCMRGEIK